MVMRIADARADTCKLLQVDFSFLNCWIVCFLKEAHQQFFHVRSSGLLLLFHLLVENNAHACGISIQYIVCCESVVPQPPLTASPYCVGRGSTLTILHFWYIGTYAHPNEVLIDCIQIKGIYQCTIELFSISSYNSKERSSVVIRKQSNILLFHLPSHPLVLVIINPIQYYHPSFSQV